MRDKTVASLVEATLSGDREAFTILVLRHQPRAYRSAIRLVTDRHLAEDVVQDAFLSAFRDLQSLREPERFGGWLLGIIRYTAHGIHRTQSRARLVAREFDEGFLSRRAASPAQNLEAAQRRKMIRSALQELDPKYGEAARLYYLEGMSYHTIAQALDVKVSTVKGRLQQARIRLRDDLSSLYDGAVSDAIRAVATTQPAGSTGRGTRGSRNADVRSGVRGISEADVTLDARGVSESDADSGDQQNVDDDSLRGAIADHISCRILNLRATDGGGGSRSWPRPMNSRLAA